MSPIIDLTLPRKSFHVRTGFSELPAVFTEPKCSRLGRSLHAHQSRTSLKSRQAQQPIITTNYIGAELVALLQSPLRIPRNTIFQIVDAIRQSEHIHVIHIDPDIDQTAWQLCKARSNKAWSLVDCTSFVIMQQMNISAALTTDHHFEQAGFVRLLKSH